MINCTVDWEHPANSEEGAAYVILLQTLRNFLPRHIVNNKNEGYLITTALPAGEWALQHINLYEAGLQLDFLNIMAYDFFGSWTSTTGHQAQLYHPQDAEPDNQISAARGIFYVTNAGVPREKIILGIPTYGRAFVGADAVGQSFTEPGGHEGTYEFKDLPLPNTKEHVDETLAAAWCSGNGQFVSYDNPATVRLKANYVKQLGLGGIFFWTATGDGQRPRCLVELAYKIMHDIVH